MLADLPVLAEGNVWVADVPRSLGRFRTLYDKATVFYTFAVGSQQLKNQRSNTIVRVRVKRQAFGIKKAFSETGPLRRDPSTHRTPNLVPRPRGDFGSGLELKRTWSIIPLLAQDARPLAAVPHPLIPPAVGASSCHLFIGFPQSAEGIYLLVAFTRLAQAHRRWPAPGPDHRAGRAARRSGTARPRAACIEKPATHPGELRRSGCG